MEELENLLTEVENVIAKEKKVKIKMSEKDIKELPVIMDIKDLGKLFGIGRDKAYELAAREDFPKIDLGGKIYRFSKSAVLEWANIK